MPSLLADIADHNSRMDLDNIGNNSVLHRWWKQISIVAWSFFIIFQIAIGCDRYLSTQPLCPYTDKDYPDWYWYTCFSCLGGFILIWLVLAIKLFQLERGPHQVPLLVALSIVSMGTIATFLSLVFVWGGVCIDVLNVASPAAIWGEWMACGPLLLFITLTIVDKPNLSAWDWSFMITFFTCLLTGFFIIIPQSYGAGAFWLTISCLTYIPVL